jgi:hypothetical protein
MRHATKFVFGTAFTAAMALGYVVGPVAVDARKPSARATWKEKHKSVTSLVRSADAIVVGSVTNIAPGRYVKSDEERDSIQFSNIVLGVETAIKGEATQGSSLVIETVGDYFSSRAEQAIHVEAVPDFHRGRRFLLFLKKQATPPFAWYVLNNQGAFEVRKGPDSILRAVDPHDVVAAQIAGVALPVAETRLRDALRDVN